MNAFITAVSAFLPGKPVGNAELNLYLGDVDKVSARTRQIILANNGIETRHYAIDPETGAITHTNAQLTAEAVRLLPSNRKMSAPPIECLCCGTSSPDQLIPGHASMVHGELGMGPCEVVSTAGICLTGITALKYGAMIGGPGAYGKCSCNRFRAGLYIFTNGFFPGHEWRNRSDGTKEMSLGLFF